LKQKKKQQMTREKHANYLTDTVIKVKGTGGWTPSGTPLASGSTQSGKREKCQGGDEGCTTAEQGERAKLRFLSRSLERTGPGV